MGCVKVALQCVCDMSNFFRVRWRKIRAWSKQSVMRHSLQLVHEQIRARGGDWKEGATEVVVVVEGGARGRTFPRRSEASGYLFHPILQCSMDSLINTVLVKCNRQ